MRRMHTRIDAVLTESRVDLLDTMSSETSFDEKRASFSSSELYDMVLHESFFTRYEWLGGMKFLLPFALCIVYVIVSAFFRLLSLCSVLSAGIPISYIMANFYSLNYISGDCFFFQGTLWLAVQLLFYGIFMITIAVKLRKVKDGYGILREFKTFGTNTRCARA
jgi:hypothetical protein